MPLCLETPAGPRCSAWCGDGACPTGWRCDGVKSGRDATYFCVPDFGLLCRPCATDLDCQGAGHAGARCLDYGDAGAFCGLVCSDPADCPDGYGCKTAAALAGGAPSQQCVRLGADGPGLGVCACSAHASKEQLGTICWVVEGAGLAARRCKGGRICDAEGLGACQALSGAAAVCFDVQCLDAAGQPKADGAACDDGRACSKGDACKAGVCTSGAQQCPCEPGILDCPDAGATNLCKGPLACTPSPAGSALPYACAVNSALAVACDASFDGACSKNACVPLSGTCTPTMVERTVEICDLPPGPDGAPGCRREVIATDLPDGPASPCDDGLACSAGDTCAKGQCQQGDLKACKCMQNADCQDDDDKCNGTPYCDKSGATWSCQTNPATVVTCDGSDDAGCVQTACVPATGQCKKGMVPANKPCNDGVACTVGDVCDGQGGCLPGTWTCCKTDADCQKEEDGNACNGTLFCNKAVGACQLNPATVVSCPSVDDTLCSKATCAPATGMCAPAPANAGKGCDDGDVCTAGEVCNGGACKGGSDVCSCASDTDCKAKDDGDICNGTLYCNKALGACKPNPATVVTCPSVDDTACRRNRCQAKTGTCAMVDLPAQTTCDADGTGCTANDACDGGGVCKAGIAVCPCLVDGDCVAAEDGNVCNGTLFCDKSGQTGVCKVNPATLKSCKSVDDTACVHNLCQPKTGLCALTPLAAGTPCSDGAPCTGGDGCDGKGACKAGSVVLCGCKADGDCAQFDDGDVCNGGLSCNGAACVPGGKVLSCDDGSPCTKDNCDKVAGCVHIGLPGCSSCTEAADCADGNTCSFDFCLKDGTCDHQGATGVGCTDGSVCTEGDACDGTACKAGGQKKCDDGNPCTDDSCDAIAGCQAKPNVAACTDGSACTVGDKCASSLCQPGAGKSCDDGNPCTDDGCDAKLGCTATANGAGCEDGDACTMDDKCAASSCAPGAAKSCDDANPCTDDSCNPKLGCVQVANAKACNDGDPCTTGETCKDKACGAAAVATDCDDKKACTQDVCNKVKGCVHDASKLEDQACAEVANGKCIAESCVAGCGAGYEEVEVDDGGVKKKVCAALGPVWGSRPDKPVGVHTVQDIGGEKVVLDSQTKLMWQQTPAPQVKNWAGAKGYCDALVYAGHKDWRLPSVHELASLVDYSVASPGPTIGVTAFPGTKQDSHWSASPRVGSSSAWYVNFSNGFVDHGYVSYSYEVRCVRASPLALPNTRYQVSSGGGVVTDTWTKLQWQRSVVAGKKSWQQGKDDCAGLDLEGKGWRLPWVRELHGLVDYQEANPSIDSTAFPGTPAAVFWSASPPVGAPYALMVYFDSGVVSNNYNVSVTYEVRCVRVN